jgi:protocatechuate 3,4-dioxygenase beta subunit
MTEGPFFTPRSPLRTSLLEPGVTGARVFLTGRVFSRECRPVPGALLDFWHADDIGEYDNVGYRLRGHQFTDDQGRYRLETIVPGLYPGRTRHYHLKVQAPRGRILTTQLFFPGEPRNRADGIFRRELLLSVKDTKAGKDARFNFVLGEG